MFNNEYRWVCLEIQIIAFENNQIKEIVFAGKDIHEERNKEIRSNNEFILMDIRMPVIDGYEATKMIRAYGKTYTNNIPIVAMTANAFEEDIALAKQSGMNEHMSKPIEFDKFVSVIMNYLS